MKIKLYSDAHIGTARRLFPERCDDSDWLDAQWTDEEINTCKALELREFIDAPSLKSYPLDGYDYKDIDPENDVIGMVDEYLHTRPEVKSLLSVGCGRGQKEIWLAMRHPEIEIIAIDNAPYVEGLNEVAVEFGVQNIKFKNLDLRESSLKQFDVTYSDSVIYCVPDEALSSYFQTLAKHTLSNGVIFVGTSANISFLFKIILLAKKEKYNPQWKQIGWMRDWYEIRRYIPEDMKVVRRMAFMHEAQIPLKKKLPVIARLVIWFSKRVHPISNSVFSISLTRK